ncbi:MAG: polysaccharide biosynthesis protein [Bacteroidota bacterium]
MFRSPLLSRVALVPAGLAILTGLGALWGPPGVRLALLLACSLLTGLALGLALLRSPRLAAWRGPAPTVRLRDVLPEAPLRTPIDRGRLRDHLANRTVLITGAGGSIGSTLSRLLLDFSPFRVVLVDVSEYNLFRVEQALRREAFEGELEFRIADVRDELVMERLFDDFRPDLVLHAAAYKHVPLMERHPVEAFRNNTLAAVALLRLCERFETEQFIFISTDKAVEPSSVLGATKRLVEWYVQSVDAPAERKIVRFGNVFGSEGSVVPLLRDQILSGKAVTLTHPDMVRFFMTATDACTLVLQTILLDEAQTYILRMPSLRIQDLTKRMIDFLHPWTPIGPRPRILYTGLRPGEKLEERLWDDSETPHPTMHPDVLGLDRPAHHSRAELDAWMGYLERLSEEHRAEELRHALLAPSVHVPMDHPPARRTPS